MSIVLTTWLIRRFLPFDPMSVIAGISVSLATLLLVNCRWLSIVILGLLIYAGLHL